MGILTFNNSGGGCHVILAAVMEAAFLRGWGGFFTLAVAGEADFLWPRGTLLFVSVGGLCLLFPATGSLLCYGQGGGYFSEALKAALPWQWQRRLIFGSHR